MPIARDPNDLYGLVDWTETVERIDRQFEIFPDSLFDVKNTPNTSVVFDLNETQTTLLPQRSRRPGDSTYGKDDTLRTYSLPLAYFKHSDFITTEDIQSVRRKGAPAGATSLDLARADKIRNMRRVADQTVEYMKLQAAKGITKTPEGTVLADMFAEFGQTQETVDFDLGTDTTDVAGKVRQLRRVLRSGLDNGGAFGEIRVYVDSSFFDKLISHPNVKEAYKYYVATDQLNQAQPLRSNMNNQFKFGGVTFIELDGNFNLPTGVSEPLIETDTGHTVPTVDGLFRGYYGPSTKLNMANRPGSELFMWEYRDPKEEYHEMQLETSPLFFCTRPKALVKVTTST